MSSPINNFLSKIGFDIDFKALDALDKRLADLDKKLQSLGKGLGKVVGAETKAAKAVADAQIREQKRVDRELEKSAKKREKLNRPDLHGPMIGQSKSSIRRKIKASQSGAASTIPILQGPMIGQSKTAIRKTQRELLNLQKQQQRGVGVLLKFFENLHKVDQRVKQRIDGGSSKPSSSVEGVYSPFTPHKRRHFAVNRAGPAEAPYSALPAGYFNRRTPTNNTPVPITANPSFFQNLTNAIAKNPFFRSFQASRFPLTTAVGYGVSGLGAANLFGTAIGTSEKVQGLQSGLLAVGGGNMAQTDQIMSDIVSIANDLAVSMGDIAQPMLNLNAAVAGTDLEGKVSAMSRGFFEYAKVTGRSADQVQLGLRALGQMASKGQVYAEEFKSQLNVAA